MKKISSVIIYIFYSFVLLIHTSQAQSIFPINTDQQNHNSSDNILPSSSDFQKKSINTSSQSEQMQNNQIEKNAIPLTPELIRQLGKRYQENQKAIEESSTETTMPRNRSAITASFHPGQKTSIILTQKGFTTAISFFDNTGSPWPIAWDTNSNNANVGNGTNCNNTGGKGGSPAVRASGFSVCVPVLGANTIEITPMSFVPKGGLLVTLQNAPKPISFLLIAGNGQYDDNLSVRVAARGPKARIDIDTRPDAPATGTPFFNDMLNGVAPSQAIPLSIEGVNPNEIQAWRIGSETFIRTPYILMSPAYDAMETAEGGMNIYSIPNSPIILLSIDNRTISASLKED